MEYDPYIGKCLCVLCVYIRKYSRLSLSRIPRDSLKHFEISVLRHIKAESEENNKLNNHI